MLNGTRFSRSIFAAGKAREVSPGSATFAASSPANKHGEVAGTRHAIKKMNKAPRHIGISPSLQVICMPGAFWIPDLVFSRKQETLTARKNYHFFVSSYFRVFVINKKYKSILQVNALRVGLRVLLIEERILDLAGSSIR